MSLEIEDFDAVATALDKTSGKFLAAAEGFFKIGRRHRHHPETGLDGEAKQGGSLAPDRKMLQL